MTQASMHTRAISACAEQAFTVRAAGVTWALPATAIQTVFRIASITPVPLAPPVVEGLVNLRGRVVVAIDLARRVGGGSGRAPVNGARALAGAVECGMDVFALIVEDVGDVFCVEDCHRVDLPAHVPADVARMTTAWFRTQDGLVPLLDIDHLFAVEADRRSGIERRANTPLSTGALS